MENGNKEMIWSAIDYSGGKDETVITEISKENDKVKIYNAWQMVIGTLFHL